MPFPLTGAELTRLARRRDLYVYRVWVAVAVAGALAIAGSSAAGSRQVFVGGWTYSGTEWLGTLLARLATLYQVVTLLVVTPLLTCESIAREKRDRTLGLLLLADCRGIEIYLSKFVPIFLAVELLLLGTLPMLSFGSFFGGVAIRTALVQLLFATACSAAACSLGILVSTLTPGRASAFVWTVLALMAVVLIVWLWPAFLVRVISPVPVFLIYPYASPSETWAWVGLAAIAVACSALTVRLLLRFAIEGPKTDRRRARAERRTRRLRHEWPARLAGRLLRHAGYDRVTAVPTVLLLTLAILPALPLLPLGGGWFLVIAVASADMVHTLFGLGRSRALTELLVTSMDDDELADAMWLGATRRAWFYWVLLIASLCPLWWIAVGADLWAYETPARALGHTALQATLLSLALGGLMVCLRGFCCAVSQRSDRPARQTFYVLGMTFAGHAGAFGAVLLLLLLGERSGMLRYLAPFVSSDALGATYAVSCISVCALAVYLAVARHHWSEFCHSLRYWLLENLQIRESKEAQV